MEKLKQINVYLSISKQASEKSVEKVKELFEKEIPDVKLSYWDPRNGYNSNLLLDADIVCIIPPSFFHQIADDPKKASIQFGKGNFNEFMKAQALNKNVIVIGQYRNDKEILIMTEPFSKVTLTENNYQVDWGEIQGNLIEKELYFNE